MMKNKPVKGIAIYQAKSGAEELGKSATVAKIATVQIAKNHGKFMQAVTDVKSLFPPDEERFMELNRLRLNIKRHITGTVQPKINQASIHSRKPVRYFVAEVDEQQSENGLLIYERRRNKIRELYRYS